MSSVSKTAEQVPVPRMKSEDRRELILDAATAVFGDYGYVGTTTDQVAKAAGVSQPYVVRMFGTKEKLFLEVLDRALVTLLVAFRAALASPHDPAQRHATLGRAYVSLLADRGLLLSLMHGFVLGSDPNIGYAARCGFLKVYEFLRTEAGFGTEEVREFLAGGMLLNTLVGLRMSHEYQSNPLARELIDNAVPEKIDLVLGLGEAQRIEPR